MLEGKKVYKCRSASRRYARKRKGFKGTPYQVIRANRESISHAQHEDAGISPPSPATFLDNNAQSSSIILPNENSENEAVKKEVLPAASILFCVPNL